MAVGGLILAVPVPRLDGDGGRFCHQGQVPQRSLEPIYFDLVEGVEISTMSQLSQWVVESDKVVTF